ncbi:MAG: anthranilate synthase component I [Dehalococcoidia bacterium]|nr:anthranilate synthase component I [Chloroflexi bacterium CFX7]MCK6564411.1 anthranilate synthase component I [Dehalococcoidia bacterium]MCL4231836.1 anthranilate synthase component I [Dehalococcoidia bacterium]NUQ54300.1 anthranilate synthase component I [Dehalococcoidia bacterium]RIL03356.1 MAG: anthranilate synthase component I [bacterium]
MLRPTLDEVREIARRGEGNLVPVYREVAADLETPVSAFLKVREGPYSFLLESVEGGERLARYSFIGTQPYRVLKTGEGNEYSGDPLVPLEQELARFKAVPVAGVPAFTGGAIGYVAYDAVRHFEPRVARPQADPLGLPEAMFLFCDSMVVFDHIHHTIKVISHCRLDGDIDSAYRQAAFRIDEIAARLANPTVPLPVEETGAILRSTGQAESNVGREGYELMVERIRDHVIAGDVIQAVPSQRLARKTAVHPFNIYRQLRVVNPSPYMFYLDLGDFQITGASPELLVRVEDGVVTNHPIAGTRPRGGTPEEDERLAEELLADEKERAEHIMLVDLGRNDVGRVAKPGTVNVDSLMGIERYSHVMHIVSHVSGQLRDDRTAFDAFRSVFPAGTVSGAPKVRAMEIIAELEQERRGIYAGAVGYASFAGSLDTCIAIRTMVIKDGVAYLQAGGGIVYDSVPATEYQESMNKMRALMRAIDQAELASAEMKTGSIGYG